MTDKDFKTKIKTFSNKELLEQMDFMADGYYSDLVEVCLEELRCRLEATKWHYPSKGELPDKDWTKHPLNISEECFVLTKRGIGTIARWDNDYKTWFENQPHLSVPDVIAWQYFVPPKEEA